MIKWLKRIAACRNAFDGIPTEEIPSLVNQNAMLTKRLQRAREVNEGQREDANLREEALRAENAKLTEALADREITIEISGGVLTDVAGLPDGWTYKLVDHDNLQAGEEDSPSWDNYKQLKERHEESIDRATQSAEEGEADAT